MIPRTLLIHTCTIVRVGAATGTDAYGVPTASTTSTTGVVCRFVSPSWSGSGGGTASADPGDRVIHQVGLLLPPTVTIAEGDIVTGDNAGFTREYLVRYVRPVYGPSTLSHYRADLEAVA